MKVTTSIAVLAAVGSAVAGPHKHAKFHHARRHLHGHAEIQQQANTLDARAAEADAAGQLAAAPVEKRETSCTKGQPIAPKTVKKAAKTTAKTTVKKAVKKTTAKTTAKTTLKTTTKPAAVVPATTKPVTTQANKVQSSSTTLATRAPQQAVAPPGSTVAGTVSGCTKWVMINAGDYCQKIVDANGITLDQFYSWNPEVNAAGPCASLWAGYAYCVGVDGTSAPSTTSAAAAAPNVVPVTTKAPAPKPVTTTAAPAPAPVTTTKAPAAPAPTTSAQPQKQPETSSYAAAPAPAPASSTYAAAPAAPASTNYVSFKGDGSAGAGWPSMDQWTSFENIWSANAPFMAHACTNNGWGIDNSDHENDVLKSSIQSVGAQAGVDPRFVLAIVIQESWGCVRVKTTNYGVNNPGLMQDHNGQGSCHKTVSADQSTSEACPDDQINQMIIDGTEGTIGQSGGGDGLKQVLATASGDGLSGAAAYYAAARMYNGGPNGYIKSNLNGGCCTSSYASDVANRLKGWAAGSSPFAA